MAYSTAPTGTQKNILSVSQLNEYLRMLLEGNPLLSGLWLRGEISNFTDHRSGHLYFSLKDAEGIIRAVMFRYAASKLGFLPEEGMTVLVHGKVTLYGKSGQYQIVVDSMQPDGIGALSIAYEQLKQKLEAEGLFDEARKKKLPDFPQRIGVITSPTGAAIRDILQITSRRCPMTEILLYPALVQGRDAVPSLCAALTHFASAHREKTEDDVDLIIIGRGGGSIEDLWAFNDEQLARTISRMPIPIISAVGHETDFTIADFVADLRAPTPSAGAELAVPNLADLYEGLLQVRKKLYSALLRLLDAKQKALKPLAVSRALRDPLTPIEQKHLDLDRLASMLDKAEKQILKQKQQEFLKSVAALEALSPLSVLSRGYAMAENAAGETVTLASKIKVGDRMRFRFADGEVLTEITERKIKRKPREKKGEYHG